MKKLWISLGLCSASTLALAQNQVSWVASTGNNLNLCTRGAPCRTFQAAVTATAVDGAVQAVDAADYGPVSIGKAITIDGAGTAAVIEGTSNAPVAVYVSTGAAAQVTLRNVIIHPYVPPRTAPNGSPSYGIFADNTGSGTLNVEDVIVVSPTAAKVVGIGVHGHSATQYHFRNVRITGGVNGLNIVASGSVGPTITAEHLAVTNSVTGLFAQDCSITVRDSLFHGNSEEGIVVTASSNPTMALIERSETSFNDKGLFVSPAGASAIARLSDSVMTGNKFGLLTGGNGSIVSFHTNMIAGNNVDGAPGNVTPLK
jgi:hypothetical protein